MYSSVAAVDSMISPVIEYCLSIYISLSLSLSPIFIYPANLHDRVEDFGHWRHAPITKVFYGQTIEAKYDIAIHIAIHDHSYPLILPVDYHL